MVPTELLWRIYYTDGSRFSSTDGAWLDAPPRGVLAVSARSEALGRLGPMVGTDFYVWYPDARTPWAVDAAGLWAFLHLMDSPLATKSWDGAVFEEMIPLGVKFGQSLDIEEYQQRMTSIVNDPDFPPQSALPPRTR